MQLTYNGVRYELICSFEDRGQPKAAGFHWDPGAKRWWTTRTELAVQFKQFADKFAIAKLTDLDKKVAASKAVDTNMDFPAPGGEKYLPFQRAGIAFALNKPNVLIADEMGLGKTIQAIGVINADLSINKILVICPASLKLNWQRELQKWLVHKMTGAFATSSELPNTNIVIANYEIIGKLRSKIDKVKWDLLICDESHYIKTPEAQRTKAVVGAEWHGKKVTMPIAARKRLFLTGTPILNRPIELWPILRLADPEGLGASHWTYARRYCAAWQSPWGWDFSGSSNLEELQNRLRSTIMIRRLKKDVLKELPPKRRQIIILPEEKAKKEVQAEMEFYTSNAELIEAARAKAEAAQKEGNEATYKEATDQMSTVKQTVFEQMSKLRHATAVAKIPYAIEYLEEVAQQEDKIVVFAHHHDVINALKKAFGDKAVEFHGEMSMLERQRSVDRFQTEEGIKFFIGSLTAAGVGITLTAASYVLFVELDWRPAMITQAEDRLHRIGQEESVLVQHLVFDKSLDATMAQVVVKKQGMIKEALDEKVSK